MGKCKCGLSQKMPKCDGSCKKNIKNEKNKKEKEKKSKKNKIKELLSTYLKIINDLVK